MGHSGPVTSRTDHPDVPVRPASTVLLVRDAPTGLEVFAQTRATSMVFAGGVTAFPGGGVDPTDADLPPWTGRSAADWDDLLGRSDGAHLVVAAVRELFEEVGVLLTDPPLLPGPDRWQHARQEVTAHRIGLAQVYRQLQCALPGDLPRPWSRWITPRGEIRRYDTHFLLVPVPAGQDAVLDTTEATDGLWARPTDLLAQALAGERRLMLPTQVTLTELAEQPRVADALAAPRSMVPVEPEIISGGGDDPVVLRIGDRIVTVPRGSTRRRTP